MAYQTNKKQDASLGLALMASVVCGVAAFVCFLRLSGYLVILTAAKLHLFEYPRRLEPLSIALCACAGLSIVIGILVMRVVFRAAIRFFE
ncbi:MAG TPA: hypothetical protein VN861_10395 [Candidatus Acidoferrales bacterium]|nr:hypothetical protein [Candidatus Acidoferrales bacterium]